MNGGSGTGDGRLDLDDLGEVIDAAATVDADVRTEVLDDGRGTSWGDRLEDAGITPWLRRHRVAVALATAVCVVAGAGATAYVRWAPPPFDPDMRVTVTQMIPELGLLEGDVAFPSSACGRRDHRRRRACAGGLRAHPEGPRRHRDVRRPRGRRAGGAREQQQRRAPSTARRSRSRATWT